MPVPGRNRDKEREGESPADSREARGKQDGGETENSSERRRRKRKETKEEHEGERGDDSLEPSWLTREGLVAARDRTQRVRGEEDRRSGRAIAARLEVGTSECAYKTRGSRRERLGIDSLQNRE